MVPFSRVRRMTEQAGEPYPFDWAGLVSQAVHPLRVMIIEALRWIDQPLSPSEFHEVFEQLFGLSQISYHVKVLAKAGVLVEVGNQTVRGAIQTFYFFSES